MEMRDQAAGASYLIPSRTLTGSPAHVLAELDQIVESLLALRQIVSSKNLRNLRLDRRQNGSLPTVR
jgi:hypothetical protein